MAQFFTQARSPVVIGGQTYLIARGGRPPIGPVPSSRTSRLTGFEVFGNGELPPTDPNSRANLVYGAYRPTAATVGALKDMSQYNEWNSPTTELVALTKNTEIPRGSIVYGRVEKRGFAFDQEDGYLRGGLARPRDPNGNLFGTGVISETSANGVTANVGHLIDVTIAPRFPNQYLNGVHGERFKLERCHIFHVIDGLGIYTLRGARPTNFHAYGCLIEDLCYYPGPRYAAGDITYLQPDGSYTSSASTGVARTASGDAPWIDPVHNDGNHSDGCEIEGGYGRMVRNPTTGLWSGDGIYLLGNAFYPNDAIGNDGVGRDPSGKGVPVPGQAGSVPGSFLGFGDWRQRGVPQSPDMTRPVVNGPKRLPNGKYASNGGIIIIQNVNKYEYPNASFPDDYTVVVQRNHVDSYSLGVQTQRKAQTGLAVALLENKFGPNAHRYGASNTAATALIYPLRIGEQATTQFAPALDGSSGLATNVWDDPDNIYGRDGQPLSSDGRNGGIRYG